MLLLNRLGNLCNLNDVDDKLHFLIGSPNHKKLRESTLKYIQNSEHIDINLRNITEIERTVLK